VGCLWPYSVVTGQIAESEIIELPEPGSAVGEHGKNFEEVRGVFGSGREVAADGAEVFGAGEWVQASGYFLPQPVHANVTLEARRVTSQTILFSRAVVTIRGVEQRKRYPLAPGSGFY
jgi:hypothetical protein